MKAIAKVRPEPGVEIVDVPEPTIRPGHVKLKLKMASVCGTDLHIYKWDSWSASRIKPPRIIGHEFCGHIVEVGEGVTDRHVGQYVASESHIVPLDSPYLKAGLGHVAPETSILGVDVDGGFAEYAVIPFQNAVPTDESVPPEIAAFQDALGNAVHTVNAGPVKDKDILITGLGPIGLFAATICRAYGARTIVGTEVSAYRIGLAEQIGLDAIYNPCEVNVQDELRKNHPEGFDGVLEMSGHPTSLDLAVKQTKRGGRISLLGVYGDQIQNIAMNEVVFKGITLQGIVGRRLWETWDQMHELLRGGRLNLRPAVTHIMHFTEFAKAMELMAAGQAGKVVFRFD